MNQQTLITVTSIAAIFWSPALAANPSPGEMSEARSWIVTKFKGTKQPERGMPAVDTPPFSFSYGGQPFSNCVKDWKIQRWTRSLDIQRTEHTVVYTHPESALDARCVAIEYHDFPTVEWVLYIKNSGTNDTPTLSDVRSLDTVVNPGAEKAFVLRHWQGDDDTPLSYQPLQTSMEPGRQKQFGCFEGHPSIKHLPFFNLQWSGGGMLVGIGWPGQWAAEFTRASANTMRLVAGQEVTRFKLHPGEEIRTPLIALQFYQGDWIRAHNVWRRWMRAHNMPRFKGQPLGPMWFGYSGSHTFEMVNTDEQDQKQFIERYLAEDLKLDCWWMDAGWYDIGKRKDYVAFGNWFTDKRRFPNGLRAISDYAHGKGLKTLLWFSPEAVTPDTWLDQHHPEWLLGGKGATRLLNLGQPQARDWLIRHIDQLMTAEGIDIYRQDQFAPLLTPWRSSDAPDRQGITEIRHVEGYLRFWDDLCQRQPGMFIDTCAGGGARLDLETLRRAVPLHASDYNFGATGKQGHTYGLAFWLPYFGHMNNGESAYQFRSLMAPAINTNWDVRRTNANYTLKRLLTKQWRQIAPNYLGDYYPLLGYSSADDAWMVWQFDRPELGEGVVQVFRRPECPFGEADLKLRGLDPRAFYAVTDLDTNEQRSYSGSRLLEQGLTVSIPDCPAAKVFTYATPRTP